MFQRVTAIRPYRRLHDVVFRLLDEARLTVAPADVIPEGTTDDDAITIVRERLDHVLLIPFHIHSALRPVDDGSDGVISRARAVTLTGLGLAQRIARELPALRSNPILMPISIFAAPAARLLLAGIDSDLRARLLPFNEGDLEDPGLAARIRRHVDACLLAGRL